MFDTNLLDTLKNPVMSLLIATFLTANPQLQILWFGLRRFITVRRVIALVSPHRLVCCWQEGTSWRWRSGRWPLECVHKGVPLQREAIAGLLADLLLDCNLVGVQLELVLPPEGVHWCVMEGLDPQQFNEADLSGADWLKLGWPLEASNSYISFCMCADQVVVVGLPRSTLQAWIDVVELADLPLRRIDWLVTSAFRGLMLNPGLCSGDLAWVFPDETGTRLVLSRGGVPELDCSINVDKTALLSLELRRRVAAWQTHAGGSWPLAWCLSLPHESIQQLQGLIDPDRQESAVGSAMSWSPISLLPDCEGDELSPLERLALLGMREDIYT